MADLGYPQDAINLTGNIYSNSSIRFFGTYFGKTKEEPYKEIHLAHISSSYFKNPF
jgi:hypothetical protein